MRRLYQRGQLTAICMGVCLLIALGLVLFRY